MNDMEDNDRFQDYDEYESSGEWGRCCGLFAAFILTIIIIALCELVKWIVRIF